MDVPVFYDSNVSRHCISCREPCATLIAGYCGPCHRNKYKMTVADQPSSSTKCLMVKQKATGVMGNEVGAIFSGNFFPV